MNDCTELRSLRPRRSTGAIGHLQTVSVVAQFVRKRSFRIDPFHRAHSWRGRLSKQQGLMDIANNRTGLAG